MERLQVAEDVYVLDVAEDAAAWGVGEYVAMHLEDLPEYDGPVEFEPGAVAQVIHTAGRAVLSDIVVDPIPSNYGLITWDGATITVS